MPFHLDSRLWILDGEDKSIIYNLSSKIRRQRRLGFTLIELLITTAVFGIIVAIVSTGFQTSQQKGRDTRRKSDLQQTKKALEAAKNDCLGATWYPFGNITSSAKDSYNNIVADLKTANYLNANPKDPTDNNTYFYEYKQDTNAINNTYSCSSWTGNPLSGSYTSSSGTRTFALRAKLEYSFDSDSAKSYSSCQSVLMNINFTASIGDGYYYVCPD